MNVFRRIRIIFLKRKAIRLLRSYDATLAAYPCGRCLAQHISSAPTNIAKKFDTVYAKLRKLDATCPERKPLAEEN